MHAHDVFARPLLEHIPYTSSCETIWLLAAFGRNEYEHGIITTKPERWWHQSVKHMNLEWQRRGEVVKVITTIRSHGTREISIRNGK